jgi:hypothetical protein
VLLPQCASAAPTYQSAVTSVFDADTWGSTLPSVAVSAVLEIGSSGAMFVAVGAVGSHARASVRAADEESRRVRARGQGAG